MAQTLPTVFQTWFTEPEMLITNDYIRPVTQQIKDIGYYDDMDPKMRAGLDDSAGDLYGIPRDGYGMGMVLNLKTLAEYGILPDEDGDGIGELYDSDGNPLYAQTFDELATWSELINERSGGLVKGSMFYSSNGNGGWLFSNLAWSYGAQLEIEQDGKWVGNLNSPEAVAALTYIQDLAKDELLPATTSVVYNDWYNKIGSQIATAFCGNDVIQLAVTNGGMDLKDLAFVPMPAGPSGQYCLFGGTPFVFAKNATDEQVTGALKFLEYMGRSPKVSDISHSGIEVGTRLAAQKNMPILPSIRPWINEDYKDMVNGIESQYINVDMNKYQDFFDKFEDMRHDEEPYYPQEMYLILDQAIQAVLTDPNNSNPQNLLNTANSQFNAQYMSKL